MAGTVDVERSHVAGLDVLLLPFIICPRTILFVMSGRERNRRLSSPVELVILVIAVAGFLALATGAITI